MSEDSFEAEVLSASTIAGAGAELYLSSNHFWQVRHSGAGWEFHLTRSWWLEQLQRYQVSPFHSLLSPTLNVAPSEAAVALKWRKKGDKVLAYFGFVSSEVAIFFLGVGEGVAFLENCSHHLENVFADGGADSSKRTRTDTWAQLNSWTTDHLKLAPLQNYQFWGGPTAPIIQVAWCEGRPWECVGYDHAHQEYVVWWLQGHRDGSTWCLW